MNKRFTKFADCFVTLRMVQKIVSVVFTLKDQQNYKQERLSSFLQAIFSVFATLYLRRRSSLTPASGRKVVLFAFCMDCKTWQHVLHV